MIFNYLNYVCLNYCLNGEIILSGYVNMHYCAMGMADNLLTVGPIASLFYLQTLRVTQF